MSFSDYSSDLEWKSNKTRSNKKDANVSYNRPKYFQKFCEKWLSIFDPWLARCEDDRNKPFCRACQCRLDCNRCHLQRHERTSKHMRNLDVLISKGEGAARQNLSIRQERSKYYQQRKKIKAESSDIGMDAADEFIDEDADDDGDTAFHFVQTEAPSIDQYTEESLKHEAEDDRCDPLPIRNGSKQQLVRNGRNIVKTPATVTKKDRMKILMQIQKDRNEMMDSFKELVSSTGCQTLNQTHSPPKEKNHVDLFFESVSSSVQALSPKLIAETKMRVSQLICELELRALTENDASNVSPSIGSSGASTTALVVSPDASGSTTYIINPTASGSSEDNNTTDAEHQFHSLS